MISFLTRQATLIFFLQIFFSQSTPAQEVSADDEQKSLQFCFTFSKLLGCKVDSLSNPLLYETIYEWLGTTYKYSGAGKDGIDCSGFVCMLYEKVFDVRLANSSAEIFKETKPLRKKMLRESDLVFFRIKKKKVSHVGIYLGNNKFAHASTQSGVIISDLDEPYYRKYFFKGGRVKK